MSEQARALIVDADPALRARLRAALGEHVHVVGEATDEEEAYAFTTAEPVDLIVMPLPRPGGFDSTEVPEPDPALVVVLLNRRGDGMAPEATGHVYARRSSELREFAALLTGLGSLPRGRRHGGGQAMLHVGAPVCV
jgi:chemotaxis response regulator CheB